MVEQCASVTRLAEVHARSLNSFVCRYFETFDVVSDISARDRLELLKLTSKCSSKEELRKF